ncbi:MAG: DUF4214 domain-containing protein [Clostridiales bacterium]|nr:DUF4214 domain-containing protein [Clostridiales bacterium]
MRHFKTKVLSIALAASLLIGSSSVLADSDVGGDWSTKDSAITISVNTQVDVSYDNGGKWYLFSPSTSGQYTIYSAGIYYYTGNYRDAYVWLYDSNGNLLSRDDDGARDDNNNFRLTYNFEAGNEYYIWATSFWSNGYINEYPMYIVEDPTPIISGGVNNVRSGNNYAGGNGISGSDVTIGLTSDIADSYQYSRSDIGTESWAEIPEATGYTYTFVMGDEYTEYRLIATKGNLTYYMYYFVYAVSVPSVFINGVEQTYSSFFEIEITEPDYGPEVRLAAVEPVATRTVTYKMPLVTATFVQGTTVTLGVEEIEGASYSWADLNDTSNPEIIEDEEERDLVCDDLAIGTHRFVAAVINEDAEAEYSPVAFEITITESAPETPAAPPAPASSPAAPASDNLTDVEGFVERLYVQALDRNSDADGKAYWTSRLVSGEYTGIQVARGFLYSQEFLNKDLSNEEYVTILYATFLGRTPDEVGFAYWIDKLESGSSRDDVFLGFAYSPEFGALCAQYGIVR